MRTSLLSVLAGVSLVLATAACSGSSGGDAARGTTTARPGATASAAGGKVGVILPDTTSARWETADRPSLAKALEAAGVAHDIRNAEGDRTKMATIADEMIAGGAKVLVMANLDSESGAAIQKKARAAGVTTIDYDRLTQGGSAVAFIGFDDEAAGRLQGEGLARCLADKGTSRPAVAVLAGTPGDRSATRSAKGWRDVLTSKVASGEWTLVADQTVPGADPKQVAPVLEQVLAKAGGALDGILAGDDDIADAAVSVLQQRGLKVAVAGQGGTVRALQHILAGDQCMTVRESVAAEADAAAAAAVAVLRGQSPAATGTVSNGVRDVPSVLVPAVAVVKGTVKDAVSDGSVTASELCAGDAARLCAAAGIG